MIPLWAKIAAAGAAFFFGRGKTGELGPFMPEQAKAAAQAICDALGSLPTASAQAMAAAVGKAAYTVDAEGKPTEFDWPPKWLADSSHKAVWKQLVTWCEVIRTNAAEAGMGVCEYLQDPTIPLPTIPAQPMPSLPTIPGETLPGPGGGGGPGGIQGGPDTDPNAMPQPPSSFPLPGQSYKIQPGDTLFGVVGEAYGTSGGASITAANAINNHAINRANVSYFYPEVGSSEANWFPDGRISFGAPYQTFYIPVI